MAGCASLCFEDSKCKFWTYNPRVSKCWMKTSNQGRSPSTKGSISGQKACGATGILPEEPESLPTSGVMTSPNFPGNYPDNLHERKTIEVAKGSVINIHFTDYELESPDQVDYLEITDGDGTLLGHFGAAHFVDNSGGGGGRRKGIKISDLTSVSEIVHVLFHTDESVTRSGWRLEWSSSASEEERPTSGVLTSPNYPKAYPPNLNLVQKIEVPEGNTIWVHFTDFDSEQGNDDAFIKDQDGNIHQWTTGRNAVTYGREVIDTNAAEVVFRTDGSVAGRGWRLEWGMVGDEESMPKSGVLTSPDYPELYPNNHDSTQTIEVAEGKTIKYVFKNFNTEPVRDYVQLVGDDGVDLTYLLSGSGQGTPRSSAMSNSEWQQLATSGYYSKSNIMHVKFHTDDSGRRSGWRMEWTESE